MRTTSEQSGKKSEAPFFSTQYQIAVGIVAVVVAIMAWVGANRTLAFAASILGLYALHILSLHVMVSGHRRQQESLEGQWRFLRSLVGPPVEMGPRIELTADGVPDAKLGTRPVGQDEQDEADEAEKCTDVAGESSRPPREGLADVISIHGRSTAQRKQPAAPLSERGDDSSARARAIAANIPVPRHFALGTVALVRNMLSPADVAHILLEQRRHPESRFATLGVELGLLTETQREELLLAQQEGLFTDEEMREARGRLQEFRQSASAAMQKAE